MSTRKKGTKKSPRKRGASRKRSTKKRGVRSAATSRRRTRKKFVPKGKRRKPILKFAEDDVRKAGMARMGSKKRLWKKSPVSGIRKKQYGRSWT